MTLTLPPTQPPMQPHQDLAHSDLAHQDLADILQTPLRLNAKAGDRVLIITDDKMQEPVWRGLMHAARNLGIEPMLALMEARKMHTSDPVAPICAAALDPATDLVIYLTSTAMAHAPLTDRLLEAGRRFVLMEEVTAAMLAPGGPASADYQAINRLGQKIADIFSAGREVHVTCPNGTDLRARIDGRPGRSISGMPLVMHPSGGGGCAFPDGEAHVCPIEGSGEGRIVFDLTAHSVGRLATPITITVKNGMAVAIEGGPEAAAWREIFATHGDAASFNCPAEIAIGTNPRVTPTGSMRTDKKKYATSHIGLGDTIALGGSCHAALRLEGVISRPCIAVDGQVLTRDGEILID